jgi:hypothetical protein
MANAVAPGVYALSPSVRWRVLGAVWSQTLISAGTYLAAKRAMAELPPLTVILCRFLISGAVFAVILASLRSRAPLPPRSAWHGFSGSESWSAR